MGRWAAKSSKTLRTNNLVSLNNKKMKQEPKKRRERNLEVESYEPGIGWGERWGKGSHVRLWLIHADV